MYLKRLEIQGFKSFPSRTVFEFGRGITAIIGPNGSGKSNVSDALRWVLGEQNPRQMRLRKLDDALFAGGHRRAPAGFAEVGMWLDNTEGWLPVEFNEVVVSRRLHRSGDTEYLLNRRRVRLRDIHDLFLKARLGQNSYAIMGQGLVDQVLSLKSDERRALIEEAAEIRRYRVSIEDARSRLAATHENVERAGLLVAEIAPRLTQLERQARRARDHGQLAADLAGALRDWFTARHWRSDDARRAARAAYAESSAAVTRARDELARLEARLVDARSGLVDRRRAAHIAEEALRQHIEGERTASARLRLEEERLVFVRRRLDELEAELRALDTERLGLTEEASRSPAGAPEDRVTAARQELDLRQRVLTEFDAGQGQGRPARDAFEGALRRQRAELREIDEQAGRVEREFSAVQRDAPARDARRIALLGRLAEIGRRTLGRRAELNEARSALDSAEEQAVAMRESLTRSREEVGALEQDVARLRTAREEHVHRRAMLTRVSEQQRGLNPAAALLAAEAEGDGGPLTGGMVGEHIRVPPGLEAAVEAALAGDIAAVVAPCLDDAARAMRLLAERELGRATVIPLDAWRLPPLDLVPRDGIFGLASELVSCDESSRDLIERVLGRVVIVDDITTAWAVARESGGTAVTRDGVVVRPDGAITGGHAAGNGVRFGLDRELAAIIPLIERTAADLKDREAQLGSARARLDELRPRLTRLEARVEQLRRAVIRAREALAGERGALAPVRGDLGYLRRAAATGAARSRELEAERGRLAERLGVARRRVAESESEAAEARRMADQAAARREALVRSVTEAQGALAVVEREQSALRSLRDSRRAELARLGERIAARAREQESRRREVAGVEHDCDRLRQEIAAATAARDRAGAEAAPLRAAVAALVGEVERLEPVLAEARASLARLERDALTAAAAAERTTEDLARLRDEIAAEGMEIDPSHDPPPAPDSTPVDTAALQERIRSLRARIRAMGPINAQAEADYQSNRERHDRIAAQIADLQAAELVLSEAIEDLQRLVRERFRTAFERVGADFADYFTAFFGGGTAQLVLTEPVDYGTSGVEVIARPPGKRLQSLSLLSGGERSMTAVALLFALLQSNPAPFCVLDEVDAALDESNVGRFGEALHGLAERTQFIVITHNRLTIQSAHTVYGVTMGTDGASSVLSLRLADLPD